MEPKKEIEVLSLKIKSKEAKAADLKRLYELVGQVMQAEKGVLVGDNPCSVASITSAVLEMAKSIQPCRVLNVGIGGYPVLDAALIKKGFQVLGIEYAYSLTALAVENLRKMNVLMPCVVGDGVRLPFRDASFDASICSETVEHIPNDSGVIREIHRVLKPQGTLLFTVPCILDMHGFPSRIKNWLGGKGWINHENHLREYTYFSAKKLVDPFFRIERWLSVSFTEVPFPGMPYENFLSCLVKLPLLKHFSLSMAFVLRKRA